MAILDPDPLRAWLIPLFPLLGLLFNTFVGPLLPKKSAGWVATLAVFVPFCLALSLLGEQGTDSRPHIDALAPWFTVPAGVHPIVFNYELLIDHLSLLMTLIVTGVGGLIHLYSIGYMAEDAGFRRFFQYLNLFIFFMLMLVLANNMVLMFLGWEGVGLCSYLLIGFWFEKESAAAAALKAMVVNRVGDVGVLIGMFLAYGAFKTLSFHSANGQGILDLAAKLHFVGPVAAGVLTLMTLCIFWGCTGKSAQLPLYTWLPDAMEGPTPVSALIHAATMVTAGVYLVTRMHSLFELSTITMSVITIVGMATALFAASIALVQNDIKRVLAYSTMSQLGYMFAACGVGAFTAGMFHVTTHAFFKACLFLGSGAVIHAMEHAIRHRKETAQALDWSKGVVAPLPGGADPSDAQDMRNMGGLSSKLPITFITMALSTLAIAGMPPFSGFFSKDAILLEVAKRSWPIYGVGALTALMTAFYMTRLMYKTFMGTAKTDDAKHTHEAPFVMTGPLIILGILATVAGALSLPAITQAPNYFGEFLAPATTLTQGRLPQAPNEPNELLLLGIAVVIALVGIIGAWVGYKIKDGRDLLLSPESKITNPLYKLLLRKWYVDEIYYAIFTVGGRELSYLLHKGLDIAVIDGIVNGVGRLSEAVGAAFRKIQTGYVRDYALTIFLGALVVTVAVLIGCGKLF